jgi:hypothetical protein
VQEADHDGPRTRGKNNFRLCRVPGFRSTEAAADATLEPSERGAEELKIQVGTPVRLEVYAHPEALVRVYLRPHAPPQTLLRLFAEIGAAIEREHNPRNEITRAPNEEQPVTERAGRWTRNTRIGCTRLAAIAANCLSIRNHSSKTPSGDCVSTARESWNCF